MLPADDFARLNLCGKSAPFLRALSFVSKFAACNATVLIHGETGTGKELAARAIHYLSRRRDFPFIPVNCGALPDNLVESELFGHVRGAFTDAKEARLGLVAQANGGTLFLDEIEAMSLRAQVALLRFLQDNQYRPVGGALVKDANVRAVASTNADLKAMAQRGAFRSDLLFRLNVLPLHMPPLRDRCGDVPVLAEAFLARLNDQSGQPAKAFHPESMEVLNAYAWPGNVRELENLIQREFLLASGRVIQITSVDGEQTWADPPDVPASLAEEAFKVAKARAVARFEKAYLMALLTRTEGNISLAARVSGKNRSDISKLAKKYGLDRLQFVGDAKQG
jgi:DNA-binding NtrC family response regulator